MLATLKLHAKKNSQSPAGVTLRTLICHNTPEVKHISNYNASYKNAVLLIQFKVLVVLVIWDGRKACPKLPFRK